MQNIGLGLYKVSPEQTEDLVNSALEIGYRLFDSATFYQNESQLGAALAASGLAREEYFVTSKAWVDELGHNEFKEALGRSLERTGLDYFDAFMIHWPAPKRDKYVESFAAVIELREQGLVRKLAVSNFHIEHLQRLQRETGLFPEIHQLELHPYLQQAEVRSFHTEHGITTQAWSPLARGMVFEDVALAALAASHGLTVSQLALAWSVGLGNSVIPKASSADRLAENFEAAGIRLSKEVMAKLSDYDRGHRTGVDPNDRN